MEHRENIDDPHAWLSQPVLSSYSPLWWSQQFHSTFAEAVTRAPDSLLTLDQFVLSRWLWITDGASSYSKALLDNELVKTKFGLALSYSDQELLDIVYGRDDKIGVFLKPDEVGYKKRLIANASIRSYLLYSYTKYIITQHTGSSPHFMKLETSIEDTYSIINYLRGDYHIMPLDEERFDYHFPREAWLGFFSFIDSLQPDSKLSSMLEQNFISSKWSFNGSSGPWLSGMPSGLAMTSFLNSWTNFIKQRHITPALVNWAAGDDALVISKDSVNLEEISHQYAKFGSVVSAAKNWKSTNHAEFLKVLYCKTGTYGYPARVYASLIWAIDVRFDQPAAKLNELAELWKQFFDRLKIPMDINLVSGDLSRSLSHKVAGFNSSVARQWLHCPRAHGGFGRLPYNDYVFEWEVPVLRRKQWKNVIIRVPDINFYDNSDIKMRIFKRVRSPLTSFRLGPPLTLPKITNLAEWEARLNREDLPIKGKHASMALDTIPLPTLDFVSTARMSQFATSHGFHVLPNLYGRPERVTDRLVNASLSLGSMMADYLMANNIRYLAN